VQVVPVAKTNCGDPRTGQGRGADGASQFRSAASPVTTHGLLDVMNFTVLRDRCAKIREDIRSLLSAAA
jgi:hypothetical protein